MSMAWLFNDEPRGRKRLLAVRSRAAEPLRSSGWGRYLPFLVPLLVLLLAGAVWAAIIFVGDTFFAENAAYALRHLEIKTNSEFVTPALVREYTGLTDGTNIFTVDIGAIRESFLQHCPSVKSFAICRRLPDTIAIEISERSAVARVGRLKPMAIDAEGCVYNLRGGVRALPLITGYFDKDLKPGTQVGGLMLNAVEVLEVCAAMQLMSPVRIESIDVSSGEFLDLRLYDGERVRLAWQSMDQPSSESRRQLRTKLVQLSEALQTAAIRGKRIAQIDLSFNAQYVPVAEF